ncbi:hypothetical protein [Rhizobium sp. 18065]|uniref:hypothetical protein n=1 Tax=Rhizobium sp. 18065 TaxID=2681411 RepID=UPI001357A051|nr:hypothetical protein [Rhizobium sp. 18065]
MTDRISCCVPYCRRTTIGKGFNEWICGKHWPLVPRSTKAAWRTTKKRVRAVIRRKPEYREWWLFPSGSPARLSAVKMWRRHDNAWERCKREAIERAAGI